MDEIYVVRTSEPVERLGVLPTECGRTSDSPW